MLCIHHKNKYSSSDISDNLKTSLGKIFENGGIACTNNSCGFHIHISDPSINANTINGKLFILEMLKLWVGVTKSEDKDKDKSEDKSEESYQDKFIKLGYVRKDSYFSKLMPSLLEITYNTAKDNIVSNNDNIFNTILSNYNADKNVTLNIYCYNKNDKTLDDTIRFEFRGHCGLLDIVSNIDNISTKTDKLYNYLIEYMYNVNELMTLVKSKISKI